MFRRSQNSRRKVPSYIVSQISLDPLEQRVVMGQCFGASYGTAADVAERLLTASLPVTTASN